MHYKITIRPSCSKYAGGSVYTASMCASFGWGNGKCTGDAYMRIVDSNGVDLASNDDSCGKCSQVSYTSSSGCTNVRLRIGCSGSSSCSGNVEYSTGPAPTQKSTPKPTAAPIYYYISPTMGPTLRVPTLEPTVYTYPTYPTRQPTIISTSVSAIVYYNIYVLTLTMWYFFTSILTPFFAYFIRCPHWSGISQ